MKGWQDDRNVRGPMAASHHTEECQDDAGCVRVWRQRVIVAPNCVLCCVIFNLLCVCECIYRYRFVFLSY